MNLFKIFKRTADLTEANLLPLTSSFKESEVCTQLQIRNKERQQAAKEALGTKHITHRDNHVKKSPKPTLLHKHWGIKG